MIIRVRHAGGTARVTVGDEKSLRELCSLVEKILGVESVSSRLSRDPGGQDRLGPPEASLQSLGFSHGAMIHLQAAAEPTQEDDQHIPEENHDVQEEDPEMAEAIAIVRFWRVTFQKPSVSRRGRPTRRRTDRELQTDLSENSSSEVPPTKKKMKRTIFRSK